MSALVRITTGIMPNHSRVGMSRAMAQFGEVVHCHKPPYSGIPGEDFVNVRFGSQAAADGAYTALKAGQVFVDGFAVGVGAVEGGNKGGKGSGKLCRADGMPIGDRSFLARRSESPPRRYSRGVAGGNGRPGVDSGRGPSPRTVQRNARAQRDKSRSRSRSRGGRDRRRYQDRGETRALENYPPPPARVERQMKPSRTPSPDPPGPLKNPKLVVNPFYRHNRSPSPEFQEGYTRDRVFQEGITSH